MIFKYLFFSTHRDNNYSPKPWGICSNSRPSERYCRTQWIWNHEHFKECIFLWFHLLFFTTSADRSIFTGLMIDPRTKALVLNGKPGHLQFYSLQSDKQLYNVRFWFISLEINESSLQYYRTQAVCLVAFKTRSCADIYLNIVLFVVTSSVVQSIIPLRPQLQIKCKPVGTPALALSIFCFRMPSY